MHKLLNVLIVMCLIAVALLVCSCASKEAGKYVNHFGLGDSVICLKADGTGYAYGFVFGSSTFNFDWREEGGNITFSNINPSWRTFDPSRFSPDKDAIIFGGDVYPKEK